MNKFLVARDLVSQYQMSIKIRCPVQYKKTLGLIINLVFFRVTSLSISFIKLFWQSISSTPAGSPGSGSCVMVTWSTTSKEKRTKDTS